MNEKFNIVKINSPQIFYKFKTIPMKIQERFFIDDKIMLTFIQKGKITKIAKTILKKNKMEIICPHRLD